MSDHTLLPYQSRWVADRSKIKVIEKARRIGLSWCEAYDAVMRAAEDRGNIYYQAYNHDMTRVFIQDCEEWIRVLQVAASAVDEYIVRDEDRDIKTFRIDLANGREISAMTSTPRGFRSKGRPGDVAILDEAAFVDNLPAVLKSALAFRIWGGEVHVMSTHNGDASAFATLVDDIRNDRRTGSLHRETFAQAVDEGLYRRIAAVNGDPWTPEGEAAWVAATRKEYGEDAAEELDLIPASGLGTWLPIEMLRAAERADAGDPAHYGRGAAWIGIDVARRVDLWVAIVLETVADVLWMREILILENAPFREQRRIVKELKERYWPTRIAIDQTGMGEAFVEQLKDEHGAVIEGVQMTTPRRLELATHLRESFKDRALRIPADETLRKDLRAVRTVAGPGGGARLATDTSDTDGHADRFWALALACAAAAEGGQEYGYRAQWRREAAERRGLFGSRPDDRDPDDDLRRDKWSPWISGSAADIFVRF